MYRRSELARAGADALRLALLLTGIAFLIDGRDDAALICGLALVGSVAIRLVRAPAGVDLAAALILTGQSIASGLGRLDPYGIRDPLAHAIVSAVLVLALMPLLHRRLPEARARAAAIALTLAIGVVWEVLEWAIGKRFWQSLENSVGDLGMDLLGAATGGLILWLGGRRRASRALETES
jgi:hypothetical protein